MNPRADAKEYARLASLTDNEMVKVWLLSAVSGALVAAKAMDDIPVHPPATEGEQP